MINIVIVSSVASCSDQVHDCHGHDHVKEEEEEGTGIVECLNDQANKHS